jgi:hypothetical protein
MGYRCLDGAGEREPPLARLVPDVYPYAGRDRVSAVDYYPPAGRDRVSAVDCYPCACGHIGTVADRYPLFRDSDAATDRHPVFRNSNAATNIDDACARANLGTAANRRAVARVQPRRKVIPKTMHR